MDKLDYLVDFIAKEEPEKLAVYINNLIKKYRGLAKENYWEITSKNIKEIYLKYRNLKQYPKLYEASINYLVNLLELENISEWKKDEIKILTKGLIQAWTFPSYYFLETLAETIGREEAIKLYKRFITHYYIDHPSSNRDKFVSLDKRLEERTSGDITSSEWVIVHTMLEAGKYAIKNKNCPTCADVSKNLPDVEFKYLAFCYGDYAAFRANMNDHIVLTMEHTIIQGDPYCSRVMHDTRIDWDLRHPPKKFWENFEPGNEEEAMKYYKK